MKQPLVYMDYAAATPVDTQVYAVMQPYFTDKFYNPSATYLLAKEVKADLESARKDVAQELGVQSSEIIFTAGGTEANNLAIHGVMNQYPHANVIVSAIEHESVLAPAGQYNHKVSPVDNHGLVEIEKLVRLIDDETVLISVMYANNEVGSIQPIRQLHQAIEAIRKQRRLKGLKLPIYIHTDAAQAINYLDIQVARLGADMMTINGGKIYGPKASGALFVARGVTLHPVILGGGQEFGLRSGTENVPLWIGFAKAVQLAHQNRRHETSRVTKLQNQFIAQLRQAIPHVIINGPLRNRLPNNIHVTFPGTDNERLLLQLESHGILAAAGSACSASREEPSHVLKAMGINDRLAQSSLRLTLGRATTEQDIDLVVKTLTGLMA